MRCSRAEREGNRERETESREGAPRARKQVKMMPRRFSNFKSERGNSGFLHHGAVYLADMSAKPFARCNGVTE